LKRKTTLTDARTRTETPSLKRKTTLTDARTRTETLNIRRFGMEWELISYQVFSSPVSSFTVTGLSNYDFLYIIFDTFIAPPSGSNTAIHLRPNNDTGANYTNVYHAVVAPNNHTYNTNSPAAIMTLCRTSNYVRTYMSGEAILSMQTGGWRKLRSEYTVLCETSPLYWGTHKYASYWKDTSSIISSITFISYHTNYKFYGRFRIYGLDL
jgi:hypothetical protein